VKSWCLLVICVTLALVAEDQEEQLKKKAEELKVEAEELQQDGLIRTARGLFEAAGCGVGIASGNVGMGLMGLGFAAHDVKQGCKEYNKGIRLEREAEEIESRLDLTKEESDIDEKQKTWWQFWK